MIPRIPTAHEGPDVDLQDETDELEINVKLEEEENTCGCLLLYENGEYYAKVVLRAWSVMVKRCQSSSFTFIHDVKRDKMEDQLLFWDVIVTDAVPTGEMGWNM